MRSNLCRIVGLLSVLSTIIGSFGSDILQNSLACHLGSKWKNQARLKAVVYSRKSLLARRIYVEDHYLLHFAKRQASKLATRSSFEQSSADKSLSLVDSPGPSGSLVVISASIPMAQSEAGIHTESFNIQASPVKVPVTAPPQLELAIPPPLLNFTYPEDCRQVCQDGYTYTPPGAPSCSCIIPMHIQFQLGIKLGRLVPLVFELAKELASGLFLQTSQVCIEGANAVEANHDYTNVTTNLVPLDTEFDNTTAHLLASRLWSGQIPLNETLFGTYLVTFVTYPGLPPPPPAQGSGSNVLPPGSANQLPLGADADPQDHKLSLGLIAVIALASAMGALLLNGFVWLILLRRSLNEKFAPVVGSLHNYFNPKPEGVQLIQLRMNAYFNSRPEGVLDSGIEVAVKVLTRDDHQGGREFIAEVEMLSRLHHCNLVKLIRICTEEIQCLVYELITNGSVESHLHGIDKYTAPLNWDALVKIALGAARGLAYLHEDSQPRMIHRDFKGSNILLEDKYTPKASDFGLAKSATEGGKEHISTRVMGTLGYVALKYAMTGHLLVKSDVYSYGVVLLELLFGRKPVDMSQSPGQENLVTCACPLLTSQDSLEQLVDPYLEGNYPFDSFARVAAIASMCAQPKVSHPPFMGEVVQALKLVYNESKGARSEITCQLRGTLSLSDLPETHSSEFLHDASFLSSESYDSRPFEALDLQEHQKQRKPLSASAAMTGSRSGEFFRHLSDSFQHYSASAPPMVSSLPNLPWYMLQGNSLAT